MTAIDMICQKNVTEDKLRVIKLKNIGRVEQIGPSQIFGWIATKNNDASQTIEIIGGTQKWTVPITLSEREDLARISDNSFALAFAARIPEELPADRFNEIKVIYLGNEIPKSKSFICNSPIIFSITQVIGANINGVCYDYRNPWTQMTIAVSTQSGYKNIIETGRASEGGYKNIDINQPVFFNTEINLPEGTGRIAVQFRNQSTGKLLGEAIVTSQHLIQSSEILVPLGKVDQIGPHWITGWARSIVEGRNARLRLMINGKPESEFYARRPRSDVYDRYRLQDCGFLIPMPISKFQGGKNIIEIFHIDGNATLPSAMSNEYYHRVGGTFDFLEDSLILNLPDDIINSASEVEISGSAGTLGIINLNSIAPVRSQDGLNQYRLKNPTASSDLELRLMPSGQIIRLNSNLIRDIIDPYSSYDGVHDDYLTGWVYDPKNTSIALEVLAFVDKEFIGKYKSSDIRKDLKNIGLTNLAHGFKIPVPSHFQDGKEHLVELREVRSSKNIKNTPSITVLPRRIPDLPIRTNPHLPLFRVPKDQIKNADVGHRPRPLWSIIILNKDASSVLDRALQSIRERLSEVSYEIILVDHASQDNSIEIAEKWSKVLPIKIIAQSGNNSFSYSNNLASRKAEGELFAFVNNDIIFIHNPFKAIEQVFQNEEHVGLIGIKLLEVGRSKTSEDLGDFKVHHIGIAFVEDQRTGQVRPTELVADRHNLWRSFERIEVASVTGAFACMRRNDYFECGGFDEDFFYGYEDVALGLQVRKQLSKSVICLNDQVAFHHRGYIRLSGKVSESFMARIVHNEKIIESKYGKYIARSYIQSLYSRDWVFSSEKLQVAFVVFQSGRGARSGDYFTAMEFAIELEKILGCEISFVTPGDGWDDLSQFHIVINMRNEFDILNVTRRRKHSLFIAWLRNNFEDWTQSGRLEHYDIVLCSSEQFRKEIIQLTGIQAEHFEIATSPNWAASGIACENLQSDVIFNGSHAGALRSLSAELGDQNLTFRFKVIGEGWDGTTLEKYSLGFLPYDRMPDVYASCKIVVDDANDSARRWGGTNSRVFDATAAGKTVLTNSIATSNDTFVGQLPVWTDGADLISKIEILLQDNSLLQKTSEKLKRITLDKHTYAHRADQFHQILQSRFEKPRISIKIATPSPKNQHIWGDYHFACSLARALRKKGYPVRVDTRDQWTNDWSQTGVNIVLRGLARFEPESSSLNIMWIISHPEQLSLAELAPYDHVFTCGEKLTQHVRSLGVQNVSTLLQCTDVERMQSNGCTIGLPNPVLFVGNTRGVFRDAVRLAIKNDISFSVAGEGWDNYISADRVLTENIPNEDIGTYYRSASLVINDHWPAMRLWGMLSNRVFDVAAAGGAVLTDQVLDLDPELNSFLLSYSNEEEFCEIVHKSLSDRQWLNSISARFTSHVLSKHTFDCRADIIDKLIQSM